MKVVFVHGRAQEKKDARGLHASWLAAANNGLAALSYSPIAAANASLPYYGDLLFGLAEESGRATFKELVDKGADGAAPSADELAFMQAIILETAQAKGVSTAAIAAEAGEVVVDKDVQNWKVVLAALRLLDRVDGVGQTMIELRTRDVWLYLSRLGVRTQINDLVSAAIPETDPCIVVAHSLGTIVAYNILMGRGSRANVKAFITIGSPLGINAVYSRLPSDVKPRKAPEGVAAWFNARDAQDTVALYEIEPTFFRGLPAVKNYSAVANDSPNHHDIVRYLEDQTIAGAIGSAIKAG